MFNKTNAGRIVVSWMPPPQSQRRGVITQYIVRYRSHAANRTSCDELFSETSTADLNIVIIATNAFLSVQVAAINVAGAGPFSECRVYDADALVSQGSSSSLIEVAIGVPVAVLLLIILIILIVTVVRWRRRRVSERKAVTRLYETSSVNYGLQCLLLVLPNLVLAALSSIAIPKESISIISKLGEGNFGEVFEASAFGIQGSSRPITVAIKSLRSTASLEDQMEFMREATRHCKLDHPNIVRLLAVCLDGLPLLLMEFMARGDLKGLLAYPEQCPRLLDNASKLGICLDLASALQYLEQVGYVHRDIAARNVLVNQQYVLKFGDFGTMFNPYVRSIDDYLQVSRVASLSPR